MAIKRTTGTSGGGIASTTGRASIMGLASTMGSASMTGIASSHYKGIASLNADDLWTACLNPATRSGQPLTMEHAAAARRAW